jgi:formate hydrogenlyase subunit 6/NADH:ubiquinone oxidoreductase subunit I
MNDRATYVDHWHSLIQLLAAMRSTWHAFTSPAGKSSTAPFRGRPVLTQNVQGGARCTGCDVCIQACPTRCLSIEQGSGEAILELDWRRCMCCGICAQVCPAGAIELDTSTVVWQAEHLP